MPKNDSTKSKNKKKRTASRHPETDCEILLNGWRSSQKISKMQKRPCPHTFLKIQIWNVLRKWYRSRGSTILITHFPRDRNCDVCLRTKITRAPCRRRTGDSVPRATEFGDVITADHKVFNEEGESRNTHRYAVVVQDLATQWIQSYPFKTTKSQETEKSLQKFLEPSRKPTCHLH